MPAASSRPDFLPLRLLVWLCLAALVAGLVLCCGLPKVGDGAMGGSAMILGFELILSAFLDRSRFWLGVGLSSMILTIALGIGLTYGLEAVPVAGQYTLLAACVTGLLCSVAYFLEILIRRLQVRLAEWMACLAVLGGVLALVVGLAGGGRVGAGSGNLPLLMAASAALLLRGMVLARTSVRWLPEGLARDFPALRNGPASLFAPPAESPLWVVLLYLVSPFALWLAAFSAIEVWLHPKGAGYAYAGLVIVVLTLIVRYSLGAWVWLAAWNEGRRTGPSGETSPKHIARWYLFSGGLGAAGAIAFYAFVFAATRVQQEALARTLEADEVRHVAALKELQPPKVEESENAWPHYVNARAAIPKDPDYSIFGDAWNTPDGAAFVRDGQRALRAIQAATGCERSAFLHDYTLDPVDWERRFEVDFSWRNTVQLLMLDARFAAEEKDWTLVMDRTERALKTARHLRDHHYLIAAMISHACEDIALATLLAALLGNLENLPDDASLARMQVVLREAEAGRSGALATTWRVMNHQGCRLEARKLLSRGTSWPGEIGPLDIVQAQTPVKQVLLRDSEHYQELFAISAESKDVRSALLALENHQSSLPSYHAVQNGWGFLSCSPRCLVAELEIVGLIRLTTATLGVLRYRRHYGLWPDRLTDCVPGFLAQVPEDPYLPGRSIRFAAEPPRLFCAGMDGDYEPFQHPEPYNHYFECSWWVMSASSGGDLLLHLTSSKDANESHREQPQVNIEFEVNMLQAIDPLARRMALRNLANQGGQARVALPTLWGLVGNPSPDVRAWVGYVLGQLGDASPQTRAALVALAQDQDRFVQYFARQSLSWLFPSNLADRP